jgi:hypothetical protein
VLAVPGTGGGAVSARVLWQGVVFGHDFRLVVGEGIGASRGALELEQAQGTDAMGVLRWGEAEKEISRQTCAELMYRCYLDTPRVIAERREGQ